MLKGTKKYWLVAMVCGLAASILFYRYLQDIEASYSPDKLVSVVVARTAIESDSRITADQLKIENIPARFAHPNALHDIKDVAGKITTGTLVAGQSILSQQLVNSTDKAKRLSYSIPNSQRAVSIAVNDVSGVSVLLRPGTGLMWWPR
jgi:pilus assembly protein CpaB